VGSSNSMVSSTVPTASFNDSRSAGQN